MTDTRQHGGPGIAPGPPSLPGLPLYPPRKGQHIVYRRGRNGGRNVVIGNRLPPTRRQVLLTDDWDALPRELRGFASKVITVEIDRWGRAIVTLGAFRCATDPRFVGLVWHAPWRVWCIPDALRMPTWYALEALRRP